MVDIRKDYIGTLTQQLPTGEMEILHQVGVEAFTEDEAINDAGYLFEEYEPEDFHRSDTVVTVEQETIKEHGHKRNCANCEYFDCNNDLDYAHEYAEGAEGNCIYGGAKDPIYDKEIHKSVLECDEFNTDHTLIELAETPIAHEA